MANKPVNISQKYRAANARGLDRSALAKAKDKPADLLTRTGNDIDAAKAVFLHSQSNRLRKVKAEHRGEKAFEYSKGGRVKPKGKK